MLCDGAKVARIANRPVRALTRATYHVKNKSRPTDLWLGDLREQHCDYRQTVRYFVISWWWLRTW